MSIRNEKIVIMPLDDSHIMLKSIEVVYIWPFDKSKALSLSTKSSLTKTIVMNNKEKYIKVNERLKKKDW